MECAYGVKAVGCLGLTTFLNGETSETDDAEKNHEYDENAASDGSYTNSFSQFDLLLGHKTSEKFDGFNFKRVLLFSVAYTILLSQENVITEHEKFAVSKKLLNIIYKINTNVYGLRKLVDPESREPAKAYEYYGKACFPSVAMLNHSCCNNVGLIFVDDWCYGVALEKLEIGTELTMNYGTDLLCEDKLERKSKLRDRYGFECECEACECDENEVGFEMLKNKFEENIRLSYFFEQKYRGSPRIGRANGS